MKTPEGMTPEERAAWHRVRAAHLRYLASREEMFATMVTTGESMRQLASAFQAGFDRDMAEHPDLAELNVRLDGYYGPPEA